MTKCLLCLSAEDNELLFGPKHRRGINIVHQNCLYLSSKLYQRGQETTDICCFKMHDIKKEARRANNVRCCYCGKRGASISCCNAHCRKAFHTRCGVLNGVQNQYMRNFKSFCHQHIESYHARPDPDQKCAICMDLLVTTDRSFRSTEHIQGNCCKNGWYHRDCLQKYANSAGYYFKCPLCNNNRRFRMVARWGISVPNRDASWELTDAFADQLELPLDCTAVDCCNEAGRRSTRDALYYCTLCGRNPMHPECAQNISEDYCCNDCGFVDKMSETYQPQEEPSDPLEDYVANQQAMRNQCTGGRQMETQMDFSSDSDDDITLIVETIERNKLESANEEPATNTNPSQNGNQNDPFMITTPVSSQVNSPLRIRNCIIMLPACNADNLTSQRRNFSLGSDTFRIDNKQSLSDDENRKVEQPVAELAEKPTGSQLNQTVAELAEKPTGSQLNQVQQFPPANTNYLRRSSDRLMLLEAQQQQRQDLIPQPAAGIRRERRSVRMMTRAVRVQQAATAGREGSNAHGYRGPVAAATEQVPQAARVGRGLTHGRDNLNSIQAVMENNQRTPRGAARARTSTERRPVCRPRSCGRGNPLRAARTEVEQVNGDPTNAANPRPRSRHTTIIPQAAPIQTYVSPGDGTGPSTASRGGRRSERPDSQADVSCIAKRTRAGSLRSGL